MEYTYSVEELCCPVIYLVTLYLDDKAVGTHEVGTKYMLLRTEAKLEQRFKARKRP